MPNSVILCLRRGYWNQVLTRKFAPLTGSARPTKGPPEPRLGEAGATLTAPEEDEAEGAGVQFAGPAGSPVAPVLSARSVAGGAP
jgi:hypothetical protein